MLYQISALIQQTKENIVKYEIEEFIKIMPELESILIDLRFVIRF